MFINVDHYTSRRIVTLFIFRSARLAKVWKFQFHTDGHVYSLCFFILVTTGYLFKTQCS